MEPARPEPTPESPWHRERLAVVVPVGLACLVWSFGYDAWKLPPRWPGTVGLTLGGDVLPMLVVPLAVARLGLHWPASRVGWTWPGARRALAAAALAWAAMLPFLVVFAGRPEFQAAYPSPQFPPARAGAVGLVALWALHHAPQLLSLEFCVRGFLLLPLARAAGLAPALLLTGAPYVWLHLSKPPLELAQAGWGAVVFGVVAWRTRSFWPAFLAHWAVAATMDALCLAASGGFAGR